MCKKKNLGSTIGYVPVGDRKTEEERKQAYTDLWGRFHDAIKESKGLTLEEIRGAFQDAIETMGLEKIPQTREESLEMLRQVEKEIDRASTWIRLIRDAITKDVKKIDDRGERPQ